MSNVAPLDGSGNLTDWACRRAAANMSRANCSECTWWQPPDLTKPWHARNGLVRLTRPTTAWFTCIHKPNSTRAIAFFDYVKVAIMSAKLNAPSLAPYVVYIHGETDDLDGKDDSITSWLKSMGVRVIISRLSFADLIPPRKRDSMERTTGICKMDLPVAARAHAAELAARKLDTERVLITDADVLFAGDFTFPRWRRARILRTFAAGIEFFSEALNSGVVYLNVTTMLAERGRMLEYAVDKRFKFLVADQSWLQEWFSVTPRRKRKRANVTGWDRLDESIFNARPFVHPWRGHPRRRVPLPWHEPRIWHWHGYKPSDVACWMRSIAEGTWPLRAWRDTPGCARGDSARLKGAKEGGGCLFQPIRDSGCRHLGRIRLSKCYLRTYTYLFEQHRKLLRIANQLGRVPA